MEESEFVDIDDFQHFDQKYRLSSGNSEPKRRFVEYKKNLTPEIYLEYEYEEDDYESHRSSNSRHFEQQDRRSPVFVPAPMRQDDDHGDYDWGRQQRQQQQQRPQRQNHIQQRNREDEYSSI